MGVSVAGARRDLAARHGFSSWRQLRCHVEAMRSGAERPTPFVLAYRAVEANDRERLVELIDRFPDLVIQRRTNGNDLLGIAGDLAIVSLLLERGADPNRGNGTPLTLGGRKRPCGRDPDARRAGVAIARDGSLRCWRQCGGRTDDIRALALRTLGTTELWSLRLTDARRHLEEGLGLARRIGRPYLEIGCLAHLGIAAPLSGLSASVALAFTEEAVTIAEAHGLATNPIVALAFAIGAGSLAWLGRYDEAEQWLERAGLALRPGGDPGTELALYHAPGLLYTGQGRLGGRAGRVSQRGEDPTVARRRARAHGRPARARHPDSGSAGRPLRCTRRARRHRRAGPRPGRGADPDGRDSPRRGLPGGSDRAARAGHRALRRSLIPTRAAIHALLFDAAAREETGDRRDAEASLERALDLAEPEGLILPFTIIPVEALLERYPRHRTAYAAFLSTILDVRAGESAKPHGEPPLLDEVSAAELRVIRYLPSNLRAPEIAAELFVSTNTIRTHLRHIYAKLHVHGRAEAVARARELGLLAPSRRRR
jgi:LuxR family transcriptional regulator, maltose regulon positive regulatory protein